MTRARGKIWFRAVLGLAVWAALLAAALQLSRAQTREGNEGSGTLDQFIERYSVDVSRGGIFIRTKNPVLFIEHATLYSVRGECEKDLPGVLQAVGKMGYQGVEFFSPYYDWTPEKAKEVRKLLDDLGIKCYSTHNNANAYDEKNIAKAIDLNSIIGSKFIVMASAGKVVGLDVVELCPQAGLKAPNFLCAKLIYKILGLVFK